MLQFSVRDTGVGIPTGALTKVFESFSQADGSTTRRYGGSGLGLAISKQLVERMGGEIHVSSEVGQGTTFTFTLRGGSSTDADPATPQRLELEGRRVLVVDSSRPACEAVGTIVSRWGMTCEFAPSALDAARLASQAVEAGQPIDFLLVDGLARGPEARSIAEELPKEPALCASHVVVMTSFLGDQATSEHTQGGLHISARVRKPIRAASLEACFMRVLGLDVPSDSSRILRDPHDERERKRRREEARVLVVEDNEVNQAVVVSMLEKLHYGTTVVDNGMLALEMLEKRDFDLVLMDCQMPVMDGYETTRRIRRKERDGEHLPVIALTANAMAGDAQRCFDAGMDDYLSKPFDADAFEHKLDEWILGSHTVAGWQDAPRGDADAPSQAADTTLPAVLPVAARSGS